MSDAFNSFCISCDQLCAHNSVYCLDACRLKDLESIASVKDMMSPLLTPSLYHTQPEELIKLSESPLLLPATFDPRPMSTLSLNYTQKALASTSHNYRLWLTEVL